MTGYDDTFWINIKLVEMLVERLKICIIGPRIVCIAARIINGGFGLSGELIRTGKWKANLMHKRIIELSSKCQLKSFLSVCCFVIFTPLESLLRKSINILDLIFSEKLIILQIC